MAKPPPPPEEGLWSPTGAVRIRNNAFGFAVLEEEVECFYSNRRAGEGYSPSQWSRVTRWRRCHVDRVFVLSDPSAGRAGG